MNLPTPSTVFRTPIACGLAALTLLVAIATPRSLQGQCGNRTPAVPVTENLWLDGVFRPGLNGSPTAPLPVERDSTEWDSLTTPGYHSGHEIFEGLDVAGDHLFVAYNAGLLVWNIAGTTNGENPQRVAARDGWHFFGCSSDPICGPFLDFPPLSEVDFYVEDVDALADGSSTIVVLSGKSPVGISLWEFDTVAETLSPVYQNVSRDSFQVRIVEVPDGTIYAFSTDGEGVAVYDVSQALANPTPCLEETGADCPGVFLGELGSVAGSRYIDILQRPTGELLIVATDGRTSAIDLELWELPDPSNPGAATRLFSGLDDRTYGSALFNLDGNDYLATVENSGSNNFIRIFNINACQGPCSLGSPLFSLPVPAFVTRQTLSFSTSNGTPFLYYGVNGNLLGAQVEQLLDLTTLTPTGHSITEVTAGGPTYFDTCVNQSLGYWPWYYPGNEFGLKNFSPRLGKFHPGTNFFYRAAGGVLDVHVWEAGITPPDPAITTSVSNPDPQGLYWMTDEILFEAVGMDGCNPVGNWSWTPTTPPGVNAVPGIQMGNQIPFTFECAGPGRCADAVVSIEAANDDPSCVGASSNAATITVKDPTIEIVSITPDSGVFTQCEVVTFDAALVGRGPVDFAWSVDGVEALTGMVPEEDLSTSMPSFDWDTSTVTFDLIFSDGFESGDTTRWSGVVGRGLGGTVPVLIELELDAGAVSDSVTVDLTPVTGDPAFGDPPIESTTQDNSTFDFHANTLQGTTSEWSWELEDDDGGDLCTFGIDTDVPCFLMTGQDITHTWLLQMGDRRVNLTASNCQTTNTAMASTTVSVVATEALEVTSFELDRLQSTMACDIDFDCINTNTCVCHVGETIFFEVVADGGPDFYDFDWDDDGNFEDINNPAVGTEFTHVYPSPIGQVVPAVRARRGAAEAEKDLRETLDIQP